MKLSKGDCSRVHTLDIFTNQKKRWSIAITIRKGKEGLFCHGKMDARVDVFFDLTWFCNSINWLSFAFST